MKVRILAGLLAVSVLLNIAGLVFFIGFLSLQGHYKSVRRERNQMAHNLNVIRGAGLINAVMESDHVAKRSFISHVDGQTDNFALLAPVLKAPSKNITLFVYLHGMGSNYLEPFFYPENAPVSDAIVQHIPGSAFLSCSYRGQASWGNEAAMSDITQNIRQVCQEYPVSRIVLIGTSMGGCTVLTYAAIAPSDIKEKLCGVVSVESAGDLVALYKETEHPALAPAMIAAFGGTPEQIPAVYKSRSFLGNIDAFPKQVKVAVISARQDDIVPPDLQKKIVEELDKRQVSSKLIEIDGGHGAPPASVYMDGLDFVLPKG